MYVFSSNEPLTSGVRGCYVKVRGVPNYFPRTLFHNYNVDTSAFCVLLSQFYMKYPSNIFHARWFTEQQLKPEADEQERQRPRL